MEKGLSPKARELLEKIQAAGEKGITSQEMRKMGDLAYAPEDELSDKGLIKWDWEQREEDGKIIWIKVCRICEEMESEERRRKEKDIRHEYQRQFFINLGKVLLVIGIVLLVLTLALTVARIFLPFVVFLLCLGATMYITSKYEEWFYPKRKSKSSTAPT